MTAAMLLLSLTAKAIPVRPGQWSVVRLADGTTVRVETCGDEYSSWYRDAQGQCYVRQGDTYVTADMETISEERHAIQKRLGKQTRHVLRTSTIDGLGSKGQNSHGSMYSIGKTDIPVLLVDFSDKKFEEINTPALIQDYLTKEGFQYNNPKNGKKYGIGSVCDYFVAQSKGMFQPNFKVLGKVTLDKSFKYYGENKMVDGTLRKDANCIELPGDAMRAAKNQLNVNFSEYVVKAKDEYHSDGIPLIVLIYAGDAESNHDTESDRQPDLIWPHQMDMTNDVENHKDWREVKLSDSETVNLNAYFVGNEVVEYPKDGGGTVTGLTGIAVIVHELGHALGLPDWYATGNDPETGNEPPTDNDPFGFWSVMDTGPYVGDDGYWTPIGYTAYERSYLGWWQIGSYGESNHYSLYAPYTIYPGGGDVAGDCLVFRRDNDENSEGYKEYFIIETRQPSTWYPSYLGSGLMLTRYAYNETDWVYDRPNNVFAKRRGIIITADGAKLRFGASNANLYGNGVNTISGLKFMSGADWGVTISNIQKNSDGSVEFDLKMPTSGINAVKDISKSTANDVIYDLQGRRIGSATKGIYIKNGKKFVKTL